MNRESLDVKVSAIEKYNEFLKSNPDCQIYNQEKILSIMLEKNVITKAEMEEIKKGSVFGNGIVSFQDREDDFSFMGVNLSGKSKDINPPPQNFVEKPKKHHEQFENLEVDEKGNIDVNQFSFEAVKRKYNEKEYTIEKTKSEEENAQTITVKNKKDGKPIISFATQNNDDGVPVYNCEIFGKNGEITESQRVIDGKVVNNAKYYNDGSGKSTSYDDSGQIKYIVHTDKNQKTIKKTEFSQGQPYKVTDSDDITTNLLAQDIAADIDENNDRGYWVKKMSLKNNILNRINSENIDEVENDFYQMTGKSLYKAIKKDKELLTHVEKAVNNNASYIFKANYISEALLVDIYGAGSGNLENHIKMLTPENVDLVLKKYNEASQIKAQPIEDILNKIGFSEDTIDKLVEKSGMSQKLISAIDSETGLSRTKRDELIKHVAETVLKASENKNKYTDDIKSDIAVHKNQTKKLEIDILRMVKRGEKAEDMPISQPNGKIDTDIVQGNTGDCWLLSGIISAINNPNSKEKLESQIKTDPVTKDVTVNLAGANKTYTIKAHDIENADHLSKGDGDVRAIELAFDRYFKEQAYKGGDNIDIKGNYVNTFFKVMFGSGVCYDFNDVKNMDFNNKTKVYTFGTGGESCTALTSKKEELSLIANHAYAVKGSDKEFLYLIDPYNSSEVIKASREELAKEDCVIGRMNI